MIMAIADLKVILDLPHGADLDKADSGFAKLLTEIITITDEEEIIQFITAALENERNGCPLNSQVLDGEVTPAEILENLVETLIEEDTEDNDELSSPEHFVSLLSVFPNSSSNDIPNLPNKDQPINVTSRKPSLLDNVWYNKPTSQSLISTSSDELTLQRSTGQAVLEGKKFKEIASREVTPNEIEAKEDISLKMGKGFTGELKQETDMTESHFMVDNMTKLPNKDGFIIADQFRNEGLRLSQTLNSEQDGIEEFQFELKDDLAPMKSSLVDPAISQENFEFFHVRENATENILFSTTNLHTDQAPESLLIDNMSQQELVGEFSQKNEMAGEYVTQIVAPTTLDESKENSRVEQEIKSQVKSEVKSNQLLKYLKKDISGESIQDSSVKGQLSKNLGKQQENKGELGTSMASIEQRADFVTSLENEFQVTSTMDNNSLEESVFNQIIDKMHYQSEGDHHEVRIQLKPDHLGEVNIKMAIEQGVVSAEFVIENQAVKEILATQLPELRLAMQELGMQLGQIDVSLGNNGGQFHDSFQPRQQGRQLKSKVNRHTKIEGISSFSNTDDALSKVNLRI